MSEDSTKLAPNQIRTQKRTLGLTAIDQLAYLPSQTHPNLEKMALPFFLTTAVFNGTTTELTISICHDNTAKIHNNPQHPIWFNKNVSLHVCSSSLLSTGYWTWWCFGAQAHVLESEWMGHDSRSLRETTAGQLGFTQEACRRRHFQPIPTDLYGG